MRAGFRMPNPTLGLIACALATAGLTGTAVVGGEAAPTEQSSAPAAATVSANKRLSEVTITGKRSQLEPRVSAFVQQIAGSYYDYGLARWIKAVCPRVTGLPQQDEEFIFGRVSEIARAAGVQLASKGCRPNLFVLVSTQPQALLGDLLKRHGPAIFGGASPALINEFIATPRPVRTWYDTVQRTPEGLPLVVMAFPGAGSEKGTARFGSVAKEPVSLPADSAPQSGTNSRSQASHLTLNVVWEIDQVFVVVDPTQYQGVSLGQLADYVGMVALAEIKMGAHPTGAATILKLFDGAPQDVAAGMSDWDQAFLKSLYSTEQKSKLQRVLIVREMVRELVH